MTPVDNIYLGNPNLKKANTQIEFTQEQILEFVACRHDPVYFAKKYLDLFVITSVLAESTNESSTKVLSVIVAELRLQFLEYVEIAWDI